MPHYVDYDKQQDAKNRKQGTSGVKSYNIDADTISKSDKLMNGISEWASYYRSRPDVFAEEYLGITLKPFQKVILIEMVSNPYSMFLGSRGISKTFLCAVYLLCRCILWPKTRVVVASGIRSQAMKIVSEKIPELMGLSRTGMIRREIKGNIKTGINNEDFNVLFFNGSWIKIVPSTENARSARANVLVLDEYRMIKNNIYSTVLRRFLSNTRQPKFLNKPEYKGKLEYTERNQEVFLSSAWYKSHWAYNKYKVFLNAMLAGRGYFVFALPYQVAIQNNLSSKEQLLDEAKEEDLDSVGWSMEMDCLFYGESANAYFKYDELSKCRTIKKPMLPMTTQEYIDCKGDKRKLSFYRPKQTNEIRVICLDIAMFTKSNNDRSQYHVISLIPQGDSYLKLLEYSESGGGNTEAQALKLKRLFYSLDCDYAVMDTQGNGIGVYDVTTRQTIDPEFDTLYPAWCSMNSEEKASRALEENALPVIYSVAVSGQGALSLMHEMYSYTKLQIEKRKLRLLINELDAKNFLVDEYDFMNKPAFEQARIVTPYLQISKLIVELTQMESEIKSGFIKLTEPIGKLKDRGSALFYGMYYIKILEAQLKKSTQKKDLSVLFNTTTQTQSNYNNPSSPFQNRINPFSNRNRNPFGR